jgi:hypothetical protein
MQLAWVGQGMLESYLIHLAQTQLKHLTTPKTLTLFKFQIQPREHLFIHFMTFSRVLNASIVSVDFLMVGLQ